MTVRISLARIFHVEIGSAREVSRILPQMSAQLYLATCLLSDFIKKSSVALHRRTDFVRISLAMIFHVEIVSAREVSRIPPQMRAQLYLATCLLSDFIKKSSVALHRRTDFVRISLAMIFHVEIVSAREVSRIPPQMRAQLYLATCLLSDFIKKLSVAGQCSPEPRQSWRPKASFCTQSLFLHTDFGELGRRCTHSSTSQPACYLIS